MLFASASTLCVLQSILTVAHDAKIACIESNAADEDKALLSYYSGYGECVEEKMYDGKLAQAAWLVPTYLELGY